jgi:hypothetical protein
MKMPRMLLIVLLSFLLAACGFELMSPGLASDLVARIASPAGIDDKIELQKRGGLQADLDRYIRVSSLKTIVAQDLIDGRISFAAAVEEFFSLNDAMPESLTKLHAYFPAPSDEEATALQVIAYVKSVLWTNRRRCREVTARLERDMEQWRIRFRSAIGESKCNPRVERGVAFVPDQVIPAYCGGRKMVFSVIESIRCLTQSVCWTDPDL